MKEPPDIGKVNRQKRKLLWYAVLTTLLGFLGFYYFQPTLPNWMAVLIYVGGITWFSFWLYRFSHNWKPAVLFVLGLTLSLSPIPMLGELMERRPAVGVFVRLAVEMTGPVLVLVGLAWGFYRGYQSKPN